MSESGVVWETHGDDRALFSTCGRYRYVLERGGCVGGTLTFLMLNPSTADAFKDDPTIRRCRGFARREGYMNVRILNLFALRSTSPHGLRAAEDPVGPLNDEVLVSHCRAAERVVAGWGNHGTLNGRAGRVVAMLRKDSPGLHLLCLGTTGEGQPRHPLYLPSDTAFVPLDACAGVP